MSEIKTIPTQSEVSSMKMLRAMVGIGVICALLIVLTYEGTLPRIEKLKAEALEQAIFKVIPGITKTKAFQLDENENFVETIDKKNSNPIVYAGYNDQNKLVGIAVEASGQGYADIIRVLYGYSPESQTIVGFYVLESKETPGLGDKIEKDPGFLQNFEALDVSLTEDLSTIRNPVITVKQGEKKNEWEVDGITGATISSRAIGSILSTNTNRMIPLLYKNIGTFTLESERHE